MKRKLTLFVVISALICTMVTPCFATTQGTASETTSEIKVFEDGSYAVIETTIENSNIAFRSTTNTKSATRTYTYYNASDEKAWDFSVKGTFSYDGTTVKATSVSTSYNTYVSGWSLSSRDASKSGAKVTATGKFKYKTMTKSTTIGLKCSANGTISAT